MNLEKMKALFMIGAMLVLVACNSSSGAGTPTGTATVQVTGTTVFVVDAHDQIVTTVSSTGSPTDGWYTLTLAGLPLNQPLRLFILTDSGLYPMFFGGENNAFTLSGTGTFSFGHVTVNSAPGSPVATAANVPPTTSILPSTIPPALKTPVPPPTMSQAELVNTGLGLLKSGAPAQAKPYFAAAAAKGGSGQDADAANFFLALSRVTAPVFNLYSDGTSGDFNSVGDLLDAAGCTASDISRTAWDVTVCPAHSTAFPSGGIQTLLSGTEKTELTAALANLNLVSPAFGRTWIQPGEQTSVESDYGDVLFFKGVVEAMLGFVELQQAYLTPLTIDQATYPSLQQILPHYSTFLNLSSSPTTLASAKTHLGNALDALENAVNAINSELDNQFDDFISMADMLPGEKTGLLPGIAGWRASLSSNGTVDGITLNFVNFFGTGNSLKPWLPSFSNDNPTGLFPDPTLSGIIVSGTNINQDVSPADGTADILQGL